MRQQEEPELLFAIITVGCLGLLIASILVGLVLLWQFEVLVTPAPLPDALTD
jgi:hypothetical protein